MKPKSILTSLILFAFLFSATASGSQAFYLPPAAPDVALGDSFSYQGYLTFNSQPANGAYDFKFSLWADSGGVTQVGSDILANDQGVSNGYFTVVLDFGAGRFQGDSRWLKIEVRPGAEIGPYNAIAPLQELTATPYALYAKAAPWAGLSGVPGGFADNVDNDTIYTNGFGLNLGSNTFSVNTSLIQQRVGGICGADNSIRQINLDGTVVCEADDNTTYTNGSGLNLIGNTFSVDTVAIQNRVTGACPAGQAIRTIAQDGTVTCQATDYTNGSGLLLAARQFSADTAYLQRRVTGTCAPGLSIRSIDSLGNVTCEPDDDTQYSAGWGLNLASGAFSVNSSQVQQRVTGVCRIGSTIQVVNADGTVVCWDDAPLNRPVPPAFNSMFISPSKLVGNVNQVTIGADGLPLILFSDVSDNYYKVAHCFDPFCGSLITTNIDTFNPGTDAASMALDPEGRLQISYYKSANTDLWFARCADIICSSVTTRALVTSAGVIGNSNDIVIASDGFALVVYYNQQIGTLEIAHCSDRDCITPTTVSVIDGPPLGPPLFGYGPASTPEPVITLGADGLGLVAYMYFDPSGAGGGPDLKVAHCTDIACTTNTLTQLITGWPDGFQPSITTGVDALGLIVYWDMDFQTLNTVHCGDALCSTMVGPQPIHNLTAGNMNPQPMVTISAAGLGVITFWDTIGMAGTPTQVVAHCNDLLCSTVTEQTWIVSLSPPAITISPTGNPLLTAPSIGGLLQVVLCQDPFCAQYFRRR